MTDSLDRGCNSYQSLLFGLVLLVVQMADRSFDPIRILCNRLLERSAWGASDGDSAFVDEFWELRILMVKFFPEPGAGKLAPDQTLISLGLWSSLTLLLLKTQLG